MEKKVIGRPFEAGHKKHGGRKAGTPNKINAENKARVSAFFESHWQEFETEIWPALTPKEKKDTFVAMLNYNYPKLTSVDLKQEVKNESSALSLMRDLVNDSSII